MGHARQALRLLGSPTQRKHLFRWLSSLRRDYLLAAGQPWIVFDAIDRLRSLPLGNKRVFEYGSGGSTLFWLRRGAHVTSVEHDAAWHRRLRERHLVDAVLDYRLVPPEPAGPVDLDPADPDSYVSADRGSSGRQFERYCRQIDEFPDGFFDLVLIDGRARPSCIKHAHRKVAGGGLLVLDNSDREYYLRRAAGYLRGFEPTVYRGATPGLDSFSETTVFERGASRPSSSGAR
jgi:hypothetical protein